MTAASPSVSTHRLQSCRRRTAGGREEEGAPAEDAVLQAAGFIQSNTSSKVLPGRHRAYRTHKLLKVAAYKLKNPSKPNNFYCFFSSKYINYFSFIVYVARITTPRLGPVRNYSGLVKNLLGICIILQL